MQHPIPVVLLLAGSSLLAGCGRTPEVRFYTLRPPPAVQELPAPPAAAAADVRIVSLAPVQLAGYLRRPQLVRRTATYQVAYLEFDRWAGQPEEEFDHALADALTAELAPTWQVRCEAVPADAAAVRVSVEVDQMEIGEDGQAFLLARWNGPGGPAEAAFRQAGTPAAAHRANVAALARRLAAGLRQLPPK